MKKLILCSLSFLLSTINAIDPTIPLLHLPDFYNESTKEQFLTKLENAACEVGFFCLTGTGIDPDLLDHSYAEIMSYFNRDLGEKKSHKTQDGQRGYVAGESAKSELRMDFKEFFHVGRELSDETLTKLDLPKNVWPLDDFEFKSAMLSLFEAMDSCKDSIGEAFSEILHQDRNFIHDMTQEGDCLMRAIYYPKNPPKDSIWAGAHTDINFFTILPRSTAKGLQVLNKEGKWIDVIVPEDAFVINCGDMLENLTNGHFKSSYHRVIDTGEGTERYSVVFFVHPRSEDRLDPLPYFVEKMGERKYANINRIELLAERLIDLQLASPKLMKFFVESGAIERLKEVGRFSKKAEDALLKAGYLP